MLKLKEIELAGFKSLPDRTKVEINSKLTIIVGPNGSGKSNVADAVLWAIGEQSAKSLRGSKMADVIFHGTKKRPPSGCAEVFLLFEKEDGQKIRIGRRLTRSGESSYLIDDKPVRLKDIHEFCYRNNISVQGSFLVEQGRVESILAMSPEERKTLFEEVAGIAHYKENRRSAESKLQSTQNNLLRLNDIITEVEAELGDLKKQAQKAERYLKLSDEVNKRKKEFFGRALFESRLKKSLLNSELTLYYDEREKRKAVLAKIESELESLKLKKSEEESFFAKITEQHHELDITREKKESENKRRFDQIVSSKERLRQIEGDLATIEEKEKERRRFFNSVVERKKQFMEEKNKISSDIEKHNSKLQALKNKLDDAVKQIQEKQKAIFSLAEERSSKKSALSQIADEMKRIEEREQRHKREAERLLNEKQKAEENLFDEEAYLKEKTNALSEREKEKKKINSVIQSLSKEIESLNLQISSFEKELAAEESRLKVLFEQEKLLKGKTRDEMEKAIDNLSENRISSLLSKVPEKTLKVIELILGELLSGYKIGNSKDVITILKSIKTEPKERISFLSDDVRISNQKVQQIAAKQKSFIGFVDELDGFPQFLKNHIPKIPRFKDFDDALNFVSENKIEAVTLNDTLLITPSGWISKCPAEEISLPSLKTAKEIEITKKKIEAKKRELSYLKETLSKLIEKQKEEQEKENEINKEIASLEKDVQEGRLSLQKAEGEIKRISAYQDLQKMEENELKRTREDLESEKSKINARLLSIEMEISQVEGVFAFLEKEKASLSSEAEKTTESFTQKRMEETAWEEKIKALENEELSLKRAIEDFISSRERLSSEKEILTSKIKKLEQAILDDEKNLSELIIKMQESIEKKGNFENTLKLLDEEIKKSEKLEKEARENLSEVEKEIIEKEKDLAITESEERNLLERFASHFENETETICEEFKDFPRLSPEEREKMFSELIKLEKRLLDMGNQNFLAKEEYETKSKRLNFLTEQKKDLEEAISGLNETIRKINETIKSKYLEAFESVNSNFSKLFKVVFDGGEGYLKLEDPENPLETGIDVFAQPSGKKVVHNIQLSGGEKALVALTLLFSILAYKPQPFFVLDEIDAPLDETNIEKILSKLLTEFTDKTQFIVISHNKRTME
ncbi:MAG: chromosome segregation protein SMC, partial [Acidobacteria bacterium]|nr:chromosome segregation protein SMC [Acidobacteriota bacterium]